MERKEIMEKIEELEREGKFDQHVTPICEDLIIPVDEHYRYFSKRTPWEKFKYGMERFFIVKPFIRYQKWIHKTVVVGRENLEGLGAAVVTCNHVQMFDCLAAQYALRGHRTFIVGASFNNMKGFLGEMMRAGDMMPLNTTVKGTVNFNREVRTILTEKKQFLMVYPEAAMWYNYPKPRPYKEGAFHIAAKYNVPVVPLFITYRDGKLGKDGIRDVLFTVHIGKPIFPKKEDSRQQTIDRLKDSAFNYCKSVYEETYGIPLTYTCGQADRSPKEDAHHEQ